MIKSRRFTSLAISTRCFVAGTCLLLLPGFATSQVFNKPIRFVTQFAAGVSGDVSVRLIAPYMAENLGQSVVIENRAGAGGELAAQQVAHSLADG